MSRERVIEAIAAAIADEVVERGFLLAEVTRRAMAERALDAALETGDVVLARCSCPTGWGEVRDANCPTHGARAPAHTVAGLGREG